MKDTMRILTACLAILSPILLVRCVTKACTMIGCADTYEVDFTGATAVPGRYQIEVVADGETSTCEITLPWICGREPMCSSSKLHLQIKTSGCAIDGGTASIDGLLFFFEPPATVALTVRRDDVVVGESSARPQYTVSYPNGPECGPACHSAPHLVTEIAP